MPKTYDLGNTLGHIQRYAPYVRQAFDVGKQMYGSSRLTDNLMQNIRHNLGNSTRTNKYNVRGGVGVTSQRDYKNQYRYKRRPRYQRRRWQNFVKKTQAVLMKSVGTRTVVRNTTISQQTNATYNQQMLIMHLYGHRGTEQSNECGTKDISDIIANDSRLATSCKVHFDTGVMDITFRNVPPGEEQTSTRSMEVDIYEIIHRDETKLSGFGSLMAVAEQATPQINSTPEPLSIYERGVTLFDIPAAIKLTKMRILKKTKIFLPMGQTFTYQIRDARNWVCSSVDSDDTDGFVEPNRTKTVLAVFKPVVSPGGENPLDVRLDAGVTRKYKYKIIEDTTDQDNYNI